MSPGKHAIKSVITLIFKVGIYLVYYGPIRIIKHVLHLLICYLFIYLFMQETLDKLRKLLPAEPHNVRMHKMHTDTL